MTYIIEGMICQSFSNNEYIPKYWKLSQRFLQRKSDLWRRKFLSSLSIEYLLRTSEIWNPTEHRWYRTEMDRRTAQYKPYQNEKETSLDLAIALREVDPLAKIKQNWKTNYGLRVQRHSYTLYTILSVFVHKHICLYLGYNCFTVRATIFSFLLPFAWMEDCWESCKMVVYNSFGCLTVLARRKTQHKTCVWLVFRLNLSTHYTFASR